MYVKKYYKYSCDKNLTFIDCLKVIIFIHLLLVKITSSSSIKKAEKLPFLSVLKF